MTTHQPLTLPDLNRLPPSVAKSVVDHVQALIAQFSVEPTTNNGISPNMPADEWINAHRAWLQSLPHRNTTPMDDSRESIYSGCGE